MVKNLYVVIAASLLLVAALVVFVLIQALKLSMISYVAPNAVGPLSLSAVLDGSSILTYNDSYNLVQYALLNYTFSNGTSANVTLTVYNSSPLMRVYLLNTTDYCIGCYNVQALSGSLLSAMQQYGLMLNGSSFNYVNLQDTSSIPRNSLVIIPSGLLPQPLLSNSSGSIFDMLDRGDTIVYVGRSFDQEIGQGGTIFIATQNTLERFMQYNITTIPLPSGKAVSSLMSSPTFSFARGSAYQDIASLHAANGTIVAFSNYPTTAWANESAFVSTLAYSLDKVFWIGRLAHGSVNVTGSGSGRVGVFTNATNILNRQSESNAINASYSRVEIQLSNATSSSYMQIAFRSPSSRIAAIGLPKTVGESQSVPLSVNVSSQGAVDLHADIFNINMQYSSAVQLGSFTAPLAIVKYASFAMPGGYYVALLRNFYNLNYSGAVFKLEPANLTPVRTDFRNGTFVFNVYSNGVPVDNQSFSASLNGAYTQTNTVTNGILTYTLPKGTIIGYGDEVFSINMLGGVYTYSTSYSKQVLRIPALYFEFAVVGIVVILLNIILKPPKRDEYYIDVPSFAAEKKELVKTTQDEILGVFDKVNYYFHWRFMPLTLDEVKSGITSYVRYKNMQVSITTQNVTTLLTQLAGRGLLVSSSEYYAPKAWVAASKHDIEYLAVFRRLRDYCVSHAMLFTDMDAAGNADMIVTRGGKPMNVIISSSLSPMRKFSVSSDSKYFIVFMSEESINSFMGNLYLSYAKEAIVLRLAIEYSYVKLIDTDHLNQLAV